MVKPSQLARMASEGPAKEAVHSTISKKILEEDKQFAINMDTMVLWTLHKRERWGAKKLREFYLDMFREHIRMRKFYELDDMYPERHHLKEIGVDIEEWYSKLFDDEGNFKNPEEVVL